MEKNRIYILGCGRSGTTLLLAMMTCFRDTYVLLEEAARTGEDHYSRFDTLHRPERTHVIKRASNASDFAHEIPHPIGLLYLVRHPLDVLTSTLRFQGKVYPYYITPSRWLAEVRALRGLLEASRPNMMTLSYENLVSRPDQVQEQIARTFGLEYDRPFSRFQENFSTEEGIATTMNGIRPPDTASLHRWREVRHREYLRSLWPDIAKEANWFCDRFGYSIREIQEALVIETKDGLKT
ncbi:MAG: sulfotransferase [Phycisphaerae bacterium]|nr:sulfotransferase [Phycisphaerae bacterium]